MLRAIFVLVAFALVACKPTGPSSPETAPPAASTPVTIVQAASDAPSKDNVRLYHVKDGNRVQLASWTGKVVTSVWHKLRVDAKGDRFEVYFDDQKILDATDTTFGGAGKVGAWTKADSVTEFDDLTASAL